MRAQHIGSQQADAGEILDGGEAMLVPALLDLETRFGSVDKKRRLVTPAERRSILEKGLGAGINGVRRNRWRDQWVALPMLQK